MSTQLRPHAKVLMVNRALSTQILWRHTIIVGAGMTSSSITTVASKNTALKERAVFQKKLDSEVDQLSRLHIDGDVDMPRGCFSRLLTCTGVGASRFKRAPTAENTSVASTAESTGKSSGEIINRLVGSKQAQNDTVRIEFAMKAVNERISLLEDKVKISRSRALSYRNSHKTSEAVREMKRSKAWEKQLLTASAALEALERQEDMLAQSSLQRELAAALSTTNKEVKKKHKGLMSFAEKAVDESVELKDDADDITSLFDGLLSSTESHGIDDDELLEELRVMAEDGIAPVSQQQQQQPPSAAVEKGGGGGVGGDGGGRAEQQLVFPAAPQHTPATHFDVKDARVDRFEMNASGGN